jgi:hypothetical protein
MLTSTKTEIKQCTQINPIYLFKACRASFASVFIFSEESHGTVIKVSKETAAKLVMPDKDVDK